MRLNKSLLIGALLVAAVPAGAQWTEQSVQLNPGWNAIFLELQPEPRECDALFAGLPIESVWRFNRRIAVVQFVSDPNQMLPSEPDWLTWLPATSPLGGQSSLYVLEGGLPYLVKVASNASPFTLTLKGVPSLRKPLWLRDSLNLAGFSLPQTTPPTFKDFCAFSSALDSGSVYRLSGGIWRLVSNPATTRMQPGEAVWIRSRGLPTTSGPLEVETAQHTGMDFGRVLTEQTLRVCNRSTNAALQVVLRWLPSAAPPSPDSPFLAGPVPLSYWRDDFTNGFSGWTNLPSQLQASVAPGATWELRLAVRRRDMAQPAPGSTNYLYQSLLEVTTVPDLARVVVPVSAAGIAAYNQNSLTAQPLASGTTHPEAGLWVGSVNIDKVSLRESGALADVASPFGFKLIVHVNSSGVPALLQKVLQGSITTTNGSGGATNLSVLLANESLLAQCNVLGSALRDGRAVLRRISTAAFGFRDPVPMTDHAGFAFGTTGAVYVCQTTLGYDDSLNPSVHRFHPDHNNLNERMVAYSPFTNSVGLLYTPESWSIRRRIQLAFSISGDSYPGTGDTQLEGVYTEWLDGLNSQVLQTQGSFVLHRASYLTTLLTNPDDCPQ